MGEIVRDAIKSPLLWLIIGGLTILGMFKGGAFSSSLLITLFISNLITVFIIYIFLRTCLRVLAKIFVRK